MSARSIFATALMAGLVAAGPAAFSAGGGGGGGAGVGAGGAGAAGSASGGGPAQAGSAAGGTGGSAAAGGTSASTLGLGATSTGPQGTGSSLSTGGSAAGGTKDTSDSNIHGNADNLNGMSKARAQDGGTWSRSMTHTKIHKGDVASRTKSMSHEPGGPPVKSTSAIGTGQ